MLAHARTGFVSLALALAVSSTSAFAADYVIEVTVDALGSSYVQALAAANQLPNFQRLQAQGAWTYNARCDYDYSVTLPNHVSIVTGRGVTGTAGHGWSDNTTVFYPSNSATTISTNKGAPVYSVFDVAHTVGDTALVSGKIKLSLIDESYNGYDTNHGPTGDAITWSSIPTTSDDSTSAARITTFVNQMNATPFKYSLVHIVDPDKAGSWGSTAYNNSVKAADAYLGQIFNMIDNNPTLAGHTALIVTADHGGQNNSHSSSSSYLNYNIPMFVWGPDVKANTDLYSLNSATRLNPGGSRPTYSSSPQPIRNSDGANLALSMLGLSAIPGSTVNAAQDLAVNGAGTAPRITLAYNAFNETSIGVTTWAPSAADHELGFSTAILSGPVGTTNSLGTYDSSSSPRRFRIRGYEARTTFDTVDLTGHADVRASIDVQIANTTYEAGDYFKVLLVNGLDPTQTVVLTYVTGTALNGLSKDTFLHYEADIPASWSSVQVQCSALTNSSAGDEIVNFDNLFLTAAAAPVPLPPAALAALPLAPALLLLTRRRRHS